MRTIVFKEPAKEPVVMDVSASYETACKLVLGAYVETIPLEDAPGMDLYVNDNGAFDVDLLPNLGGIDGAVEGIVRGPVFVGGYDSEGEVRSLTEAEQTAALEYLKSKALSAEDFEKWKDVTPDPDRMVVETVREGDQVKVRCVYT